MPAPSERARPILTFNDAVTFHMNGEEVRAFLAPPAHTDGDSFVYFVDSDVLHLGDVFQTNGEYPLIDVYNGGSVSGMIEAMEIAIGLAGPNTKVIPGHGFGLGRPGRTHRGADDARRPLGQNQRDDHRGDAIR